MGRIKSINTHQIIAMIIISVGYIHLGNVVTFPTLLTLQGNSTLYNIYMEELPMTSHQLDRLSGIMAIGTLSSCLTVHFVTSRYGKKIVMTFGGVAAFVAWIGIAVSPNVTTLEVFRVLCGISIGIITICGTNYLAEIVEPRYRGVFISILDSFIVFGNLITCTLGNWLPFYKVSFVNATLPIIFTLGLFLLPESPTFLVVKGEMKKARAVLHKIRNNKDDIDAELDIFYYVNVTQVKDKKVWEGLKMPEFTKRIIIVLILYFIRCFAGYEVFVANPSRMFEVYDVIDAKIMAIIMTFVQLLSVILFSLFFIETIGRRKCMLLSIGVTTLGLLLLSGFHLYDQQRYIEGGKSLRELNTLESDHSLLQSESERRQSEWLIQNDSVVDDWFMIEFVPLERLKPHKEINNSEYSMLKVVLNDNVLTNDSNNINDTSIHDAGEVHNFIQDSWDEYLEYLPVVGLMIAIIGFNFGIATIPFVVTSEYFPTWLRAEATCICLAGFTIFQFLTLVSYTSMLDALTTGGFFLLCSILCALAIPLTIYWMPETMDQIVA